MSEHSISPPTPGNRSRWASLRKLGPTALWFFLDFCPSLVLTGIAQVYFFSFGRQRRPELVSGPTYQVFRNTRPKCDVLRALSHRDRLLVLEQGIPGGYDRQVLAKRFLGCSTVRESTNEPIGAGGTPACAARLHRIDFDRVLRTRTHSLAVANLGSRSGRHCCPTEQLVRSSSATTSGFELFGW